MKLLSSQKGFTLIELLVAMAISGMVLTALVTSIFQTTKVSTQASTQITALEDIKSVARPITPDVWMAQTTKWYDGTGTLIPLPDDTPVDNLVLDWTSWYDDSSEMIDPYPVKCRCEYTFLETEGKVQRKYWEDDGVGYEEISTTTFGRYISGIEFSLHAVTEVASYIQVTITSSPEGRAETEEQKTYHISLKTMEEDPTFT